MARSDVFHRFMRSLRIADACNQNGWSSREGVERAREQDSLRISRRRALGGATIAAGALLGCSGAEGQGQGQIAIDRARSALPRSNLDVGIVGAGLAGLSCANELKRAGVAATIYEASARAGGRCFSLGGAFAGPVSFPGQVVERGGELIDNLHKTMLGYAQEFGLALEDYEKLAGDEFFYFDGGYVSEEVVVDEYRQFVEAMHDDLRTLSPPTADAHTPADVVLDRMTLREYFETRGAGPVLKQVLDVVYNIEYGLEIDKQSALNFLLFIHADRRSRFQPFGVYSDERYHIVSGNQGIVSGLTNKIGSSNLRYGRELVRIAKRSDGRIELTLKEGSRSIVAVHDAVVIGVPFSVLKGVELHSSLGIPEWKRYAIDNFSYGTNSKMMVGFKEPLWRALGSTGAAYSDLPDFQSSWETNPSAATSAHAVLTHYTGGNLGARLDPAKTQSQVAAFLDAIDKVFPGAKAKALRDSKGNVIAHIEAWARNPYAKGSYTGNAPGYFTTIEGNAGKPIGNLYFAGEHTDSFYSWQGFMEGACLSGLRAAGEVLDG